MATQRLTREESQQRTRQRLLDAAEALFARKGIQATSLEQIAQKAGLTRGAIYANFTGKSGLVYSLRERAAQQGIAHLGIDRTRPLNEQLRLVGRRLIEGLQQTPKSGLGWWLLDREYTLFAARDREMHKREAQRYRHAAAEGGPWLEAWAAECGQRLRVPGEQAMALLMLIIQGLVEHWMLDPNAVTPELAEQALVGALISGV